MRFVEEEKKGHRDWEELSDPDRHRVRAAEGWLDFGLLCEAAEELSGVKAGSPLNPLILRLQLRLWCQAYLQLQEWENLLGAVRAADVAAPERGLANLYRSTALVHIAKIDEALKLLAAASTLAAPIKGMLSDLESYAAKLQE